jgi:hypothetical protein
MHWLKLLAEGWLAFGAATVVIGLFWTTRLSRQMNPEAGKAPSLPERAFGASSFTKLHSA